MKKLIYYLTLLLCLILTMITPLQAKSLKAAKAFDMHHGSNLFVSTNGYDRIQAIYDNMNDQNLRQVVVEKYDTHFKIKSQKFLSLDYLTPARTNQDHIFWGGIYPGSQYYFIVTALKIRKKMIPLMS